MGVALSCCLAALLSSVALAAPKVKGERSYQEHEKIVLRAQELTSTKAQCLWDVDGAADIVEAGDTLYVWAAPGTYRVKLTAVDFDTKKIERASFSFTVVGKTPPAPPGPGPTPPTPTPPAPGVGSRVLIVYESADLTKLPAAQLSVLYAKSVRDYLNSKCALGSDGKTREWRIWDRDVDATSEGKSWQALLARPRKSVPWLVIGTDAGNVAHEGALPATVADMLATLRRHMEASSMASSAKKRGG